jgi:uncharacterized protein (TIGR00251 family)
MLFLRNTGDGVTLTVKVHPRARKNAVTGVAGDALKLSITAPPVEGRANEACLAFLAEILEVPRASITIAAGQTGRRKLMRVAGLTVEQARERLATVLNESTS